MTGTDPTEVHVRVADIGQVHEWFVRNAAQEAGVWFVFVKGKARTVEYADIVDEAICFGWVDSRSRSVDPAHTSLYVAPRQPKSAWSDSNRQRVERLTAEARMQPAGLAAVQSAKAAGRW